MLKSVDYFVVDNETHINTVKNGENKKWPRKCGIHETWRGNVVSLGTLGTSALFWIIPAGICLLKVSNRNTRTRCGLCSKLTIKTPEWRHWRRSGVFIVNFEHILQLVLVLLLLTLNMWLPAGFRCRSFPYFILFRQNPAKRLCLEIIGLLMIRSTSWLIKMF